MLYRAFSAVVVLTITAGFLGWIKSGSGSAKGSRIDELLTSSVHSTAMVKKFRSQKNQVSDFSR